MQKYTKQRYYSYTPPLLKFAKNAQEKLYHAKLTVLTVTTAIQNLHHSTNIFTSNTRTKHLANHTVTMSPFSKLGPQKAACFCCLSPTPLAGLVLAKSPKTSFVHRSIFTLQLSDCRQCANTQSQFLHKTIIDFTAVSLAEASVCADSLAHHTSH